MNADRIAPVAVALLAVVALGIAAATVDSATTDGGRDGAGTGEGGGVGPGEGPIEIGGPDPVVSGGVADDGMLWWLRVLLALFLLAALAGLALRVDLRAAAALVALSVVGAVLLLMLLEAPGVFDSGVGNLSTLGEEFSLPGGSGGPADRVDEPTVELGVPTALLGLIGLAVLAAVAVVVRTGTATGDGDPTMDQRFPDSPATDAEAVGRAAGRAADRLDAGDADAENAIYRAWLEMTAALDVADPETCTPGEFADAAVEAGLDREDVDELTRLFEAVRYGDAPATPTREERARAALERIEAAYADDRERGGDGP